MTLTSGMQSMESGDQDTPLFELLSREVLLLVPQGAASAGSAAPSPYVEGSVKLRSLADCPLKLERVDPPEWLDCRVGGDDGSSLLQPRGEGLVWIRVRRTDWQRALDQKSVPVLVYCRTSRRTEAELCVRFALAPSAPSPPVVTVEEEYAPPPAPAPAVDTGSPPTAHPPLPPPIRTVPATETREEPVQQPEREKARAQASPQSPAASFPDPESSSSPARKSVLIGRVYPLELTVPPDKPATPVTRGKKQSGKRSRRLWKSPIAWGLVALLALLALGLTTFLRLSGGSKIVDGNPPPQPPPSTGPQSTIPNPQPTTPTPPPPPSPELEPVSGTDVVRLRVKNPTSPSGKLTLEIQRQNEDQSWSTIGTLTGEQSHFYDRNLSPMTHYRYQLIHPLTKVPIGRVLDITTQRPGSINDRVKSWYVSVDQLVHNAAAPNCDRLQAKWDEATRLREELTIDRRALNQLRPRARAQLWTGEGYLLWAMRFPSRARKSVARARAFDPSFPVPAALLGTWGKMSPRLDKKLKKEGKPCSPAPPERDTSTPH